MSHGAQAPRSIWEENYTFYYNLISLQLGLLFFQNNLHVVTRHGYAGYRSLYGIGPQMIRVLLHTVTVVLVDYTIKKINIVQPI